MSQAQELVVKAKQWASSYGRYANGEEGAVLSVPLRFRAAWENHDVDVIADTFVENGTLVVGDEILKGRESIREYFAEAFAGSYKGTRLSDTPQEVRLLTDDTALAVTVGGVLRNGDESVPADRQSRTVWLIVLENDDWKLFSHQSNPMS